MPPDIYLTDILLLCATCHQPIKARITTPNWLRVEWIGPSGECLACHQESKREQEGSQKEVKRIASAPERIWLQVGDDVKDEHDMAEVSWNDVSWCREKIFDTDIEYVRIDYCKGAKPSE